VTQLIRWENARVALAALNSYDEVNEVMDQAERVALYARQASDRELIQHATEVRTRAQRRAGEMLALTAKLHGSRGVGRKVESTRPTPPTLADIGITKYQSANWQALAAMSVEHFESTVEAAKEAAGEVTTAFMIRAAKKHRWHGKPKKGKKADAMRKELKAAMDRSKSMLCECARLLIGAIQASEGLTEDERDLLDQVANAITNSRRVSL